MKILCALAVVVVTLPACSHSDASSGSQAQASAGASTVAAAGSAWTARASAPGTPGPDLAGQPGTTFDVTFTDRTVAFETSEIPEVVGAVSQDGAYFALNAKNAKVAALKAGDVLFVKGLALRNILDVSRDGDVVVAHTAPAAIGDAIKNGKIAFEAPVDWGKVAAAPRPDPIAALMERVSEPASAESLTAGGVTVDSTAHTVSGTLKGWDVSAGATPSGGNVDLSLNVSRTIGAAVIKVTGTGSLSNFDTSGSIDVVNGVVDKLSFINKHITAAMDFEWSVAKDDPGVLHVDNDERVLKLPTSIETPIFIGGMPFEIGITESIKIDPAITGGKEFASGKYHVSYSGTEGFTAEASDAQTSSGGTADAAVIGKAALSAIAPLGFVAAVALPKVELATGPAAFKDELAKYTSAVPAAYTDIFKAALQKSETGRGIVQAVDDFSSSGIAGYTSIVLSIGYTYAGASDISNCQSTQIFLDVNAGADAKWMSTSISPSTSKRLQAREDVAPDIARCHLMKADSGGSSG